MRHIKPLKVARRARHLNGITEQTQMPRRRVPPHRMAVDIEVIRTPRRIPEPELPANPPGVTRDEAGDGGLGADAGVVAQGVDGEGHEEEVGVLGAGGEEGGGAEEGGFEDVLAVVVEELGVEGVWVGEENG